MNIRTSIILVVLLAMVAGYVFFVQVRIEPEVKEEALWFYSVDMSDINHITIDSSDGNAQFFLGDDKYWHLDSPDGLPAGLDRWIGVELLLSGPKSRRLIDEQLNDLEPYGLSDPSVRIGIGLKDGTMLNILVGSPTPDGENNYALVENSEQVFTVFSGWEEVMTRLVTDPPYPEWLYDINITEVTHVAITKEHGGIGLKKVDQKWFLSDISRSPVDDSTVEKVLKVLENPDQTIVAYDPMDVEQYGLDSPSILLYVQTEKVDQEGFTEVSQFRFHIGNITEDGSGYFVRTERGEFIIEDVFKVNSEWVDGIESVVPEVFRK